METIVTNANIEATEAYKKLAPMFQKLCLKLANKKIMTHGLISWRKSGVIPGSIAGNNLKVLKELISNEPK